MWNFSLMAATRSIETSMPFVLYRFMVFLAISLALLFGTLAGAGTLIAFASFSANPTALASVGALLGFAGLAYLLYMFRGSALFNAQVGTLALLVEQTRVAKLPEGKAQIEFAKKAAAERFTPFSYVEVGSALGAALSTLPAPACPLLDRMNNAALSNAGKLLSRLLSRLCGPAIMALNFADSAAANPWKSAERGLVIHAAHTDALVKFRLYGLLFEMSGIAASFVLMLYPVDYAVSMLPVDVGFWRYVFALAFTGTLEGAFFNPIVTAAMAQLYLAQDKAMHNDIGVQIAALAEQNEAIRLIHEKAG